MKNIIMVFLALGCASIQASPDWSKFENPPSQEVCSGGYGDCEACRHIDGGFVWQERYSKKFLQSGENARQIKNICDAICSRKGKRTFEAVCSENQIYCHCEQYTIKFCSLKKRPSLNPRSFFIISCLASFYYWQWMFIL